MSIPLTDGTSHSLRAYLREVKTTQSEIGKRERFASLLGTLFPNQREIGIYARGAETSLRIMTPEKERTGRADTIYGSAVVEFEKRPQQNPLRGRTPAPRVCHWYMAERTVIAAQLGCCGHRRRSLENLPPRPPGKRGTDPGKHRPSNSAGKFPSRKILSTIFTAGWTSFSSGNPGLNPPPRPSGKTSVPGAIFSMKVSRPCAEPGSHLAVRAKQDWHSTLGKATSPSPTAS